MARDSKAASAIRNAAQEYQESNALWEVLPGASFGPRTPEQILADSAAPLQDP